MQQPWRRPLAIFLLLAAAVRLWRWSPAPDWMLGGPLPLDAGAWAALALLRRGPVGGWFAAAPHLAAWAVGLLGFGAGLLVLGACLRLSWAWWQKDPPANHSVEKSQDGILRQSDAGQGGPAPKSEGRETETFRGGWRGSPDNHSVEKSQDGILRQSLWWLAPLMLVVFPVARFDAGLGSSPAPLLLGSGLLLGLMAQARLVGRGAGVAAALVCVLLGGWLLSPGLLGFSHAEGAGLSTPLLPGVDKSFSHLLLPMGLLGPLFVLTPLLLWLGVPGQGRLPAVLMGVGVSALAAWQARFLPLAAPFFALGLTGWLVRLQGQLASVPGPGAKWLPVVLGLVSLLPCLLARRGPPLSPELAATGQVLAQARRAGLTGNVLVDPALDDVVLALSQLTPVPGPEASRHLGVFATKDCDFFAREMDTHVADYFLGTAGLLPRLPRLMQQSGLVTKVSREFPVFFDRQYQDWRFRHLGAATVYDLCPWHLVTSLGSDITILDVKTPSVSQLAPLMVSGVMESVNFGRGRREVAGAALFRRVAKPAVVQVSGPPGLLVLGRLPLTLKNGPKPQTVFFETRAKPDKLGRATLKLPFGGPVPRGGIQPAGPLVVVWQDMRFVSTPLVTGQAAQARYENSRPWKKE